MSDKIDNEIEKQKIIDKGRNESYRLLNEAVKKGDKETAIATVNILTYTAINILAQRALNMVEHENKSLAQAIMLVKNEIEMECEFLDKTFKPKHFKF